MTKTCARTVYCLQRVSCLETGETVKNELYTWNRHKSQIIHCRSILHLEIILNHSYHSPFLAIPVSVKWAPVSQHDFLSIFSKRLRQLAFISDTSFSKCFSRSANSSCSRACSHTHNLHYPLQTDENELVVEVQECKC